VNNNLDQAQEPDLFARCWRQRWKVVLTFLVVLVLTGVITSISEKQYDSEAKLQVQVGRESIALDPTATIGAYVGVADSRETEIQAFEELILSKNVLGKVVERVGVDNMIGPAKWYSSGNLGLLDEYNLNPLRVYDRSAKALKHLELHMKLHIPRNSKIITLSYQSDDPKQAQQVVQTVIDVAIEEHSAVNRNQQSLKFFETETKRLHDKVMALEQELADEKSKTGISDVDHQRKILLDQIAKYKDEIGHLSARGFALKKELAIRKQQLNTIAQMQLKEKVSFAGNSPEAEMKVELFRLELKEKELAAKYNDSNEQLKMVREQLRLVRESVKNDIANGQVTQGNNEERDRYELALFEREAELVEGEARQEQLKVDLAALKDSLADLDNKAKRIHDLLREISLSDLAYRKYNESLEIARIEQQRYDGHLSNIKMLQEPSFSTQPTSPKILFNFVLGTILAGMMSVGVVAFSERNRTGVVETSPSREPPPRDVILATPEPQPLARRETISIHS
jgi:uncharacterized protein involved in exopolysaccharide biosynthesis